jgi:isoamylase
MKLMLAEFANRLTGSSDLYLNDYRRPTASINFITAHDGFTLHDLVSYNEKHNEANGEDNNDGESHNRSWNCGAEGPTEDPEINRLRDRQKRNFLTTLFLSQGVPMLVAGDELSRTQNGNNNAYCQDNEISWINWDKADTKLLEFTRKLIKLRTVHAVFRRRRWFQGQPIHGLGLEDIAWFLPDGSEMADDHWNEDHAKCLAVYLNGRGVHTRGAKGELILDDSFYVIFNAAHHPMDYQLPPDKYGTYWNRVIDTSEDLVDDLSKETFPPQATITVESRSIVVLKNPAFELGSPDETETNISVLLS